MSEQEETRLCFIQRGDSQMEVQVVGDGNTLMNMLHSSLMSHLDLRKIIMPVVMKLLKDDEFLKVTMNDMLSSLKELDDDKEDDKGNLFNMD